MKRRDFCKALVCSAALAPGLALPRAEAAAKSQTVGRAVPAGNYTMSFRSELSQMDIEHEYYYSDSFFAHASIQYDHQLALATLGHGDGLLSIHGPAMRNTGPTGTWAARTVSTQPIPSWDSAT